MAVRSGSGARSKSDEDEPHLGERGFWLGAAGALIGALVFSHRVVGGALIGAAAGLGAAAWWALRERLGELSRRNAVLAQRVGELARALDDRAQVEPVERPRSIVSEAPHVVPAAPAAPSDASEPPASTSTAALSAGEADARQPQSAGTRPEDDWSSSFESSSPSGAPSDRWLGDTANGLRELLMGGNTVVRIGVLVLLVGVALLAKYAVEHALLPIEVRLVLAAAIGMALVSVGVRARHDRPEFGTTLQGGGIGALYLTIFFAFRVYELVPGGLAFLLLATVAVASGVLAVLQSSQPLLFIGSLGGFAAPVIASTGSGNHVALFGYYLLLDAIVAAVSWYRSWRWVNLLAFFGTYAVATAWGVLRYRPEDLVSTEPFVVAFWALFTAIAVIFAWRRPPQLRGLVDGTLVFGTPILTLLIQVRLLRDTELGVAFSAVALGLAYAGLATWIWRVAPANLRRLCEAFLALSIGFGTMAIPLAVESAMTTATAWALEGAGLFWVGFRQDNFRARLSGIGLQVLGAVSLFIAVDGNLFRGWAGQTEPVLPVANGRLLACAALALSGLFIAWLWDRHDAARGRRDAVGGLVAAHWGVLWWLLGTVGELGAFLPEFYFPAALVAALGASALVIECWAARIGWSRGRLLTLWSLPLGFAALVFAADRAEPVLAGMGWLAWPFTLGAVYRLLLRLESLPAPAWLSLAYAPALWLTTAVLAEGVSGFVESDLRLGHDWGGSMLGLALAAGLYAGVACVRAGIGPFGRYPTVHLGAGAKPLIVAGAVWAFSAGLAIAGDFDPLAYVPMINPADIAFGALVLGAVRWWLAIRQAAFSAENAVEGNTRSNWVRAFLPGLGLIGFWWMNVILARSVHRFGGLPYDLHRLLDSVAFQSALSISWTLVAVGGMLAAARRGLRVLWIVMAILLATVVLKLFLVDLAQLGTLTRIVTFLVVGLLMLVVGYVAPVPPAPAPRTASVPGDAVSGPEANVGSAGELL